MPFVHDFGAGGGTLLSTSDQVKPLPMAGIAINGKMVSGIRPVVVDGTVYLPFVQLSKILGYNDIQYNRKNATFQVSDGFALLRAAVGGEVAYKSNEYIHIEPLRWVDQTVYISLSAGSDLFNVFLNFLPKNGSIQVQKPANNLKSNIIIVGSKLRIPS